MKKTYLNLLLLAALGVTQARADFNPVALTPGSFTVDAIVETRIFEYHGESRKDLYYTKEMLLAVGDKYEAQIAKDRAADAPYR